MEQKEKEEIRKIAKAMEIEQVIVCLREFPTAAIISELDRRMTALENFKDLHYELGRRFEGEF